MRAHRQAAFIPENPELESMLEKVKGLSAKAERVFEDDGRRRQFVSLCTSLKILIQSEGGFEAHLPNSSSD